MKSALIVFQKNPVLRKVKTRLANKIGDEAALKVYEALVEITNQSVKNCRADSFIFFSDFIPNLPPNTSNQFRIQSGADLGGRMRNAFQEVFEMGYDSICIIGSDCPLISGEVLDLAFNQLHTNDVILGPAKDGGYYLLGMKRLVPELFEGINWSTDGVQAETLEKAQNLSLSVSKLPEFYDIDTVEDLSLFISQFPEYAYLSPSDGPTL